MDTDSVTTVVCAALGRTVRLREWHVTDVDYSPGSPATAGLHRVRGVTDDGESWSVFLKLLQHARHWERLHLLPPELREPFSQQFPWRQELVAWEPPFAACLPSGFRLPLLYQVDDLGDDRLAVWMEDILTLDDAWELDRFERAAYALGGLAALRSTPEMLATNEMPKGFGLRGYCDGRVLRGAVPMLDTDAFWQHPVMAGTADKTLRADLRELATRIPAILDQLDDLPQALPHGDASPQNLLVPIDAADTFVAIDISFQCPLAVGFDLGQLLVGLVHAGQMPAAALPDVHAVLVPQFVSGMNDHGADVSSDDVMSGYVGSLVARAGFTALPFELLDAPPTADLTALFAERVALTRFIIDLGRQHFTEARARPGA